MPKFRTFSVSARITVETDVTIRAVDLEEASRLAKELKITDFVEILGNHIDHEPVDLRSVYELR